MSPFQRISEYLRNRNKLKYRFYKFHQNHSKADQNSPTVLIWELGGFAHILRKNAIISAALNFRGYRTHFIVCDGTPLACIQIALACSGLLVSSLISAQRSKMLLAMAEKRSQIESMLSLGTIPMAFHSVGGRHILAIINYSKAKQDFF